MPKMKTNKAVLKRFRVTARGKVLFRHAGKAHLLSAKNAKRRRHMRRPGRLHTFNSRIIRRLSGQESSAAPNPPPKPDASGATS